MAGIGCGFSTAASHSRHVEVWGGILALQFGHIAICGCKCEGVCVCVCMCVCVVGGFVQARLIVQSPPPILMH